MPDLGNVLTIARPRQAARARRAILNPAAAKHLGQVDR
jgi:hypothetical protein